MNAALPATHGDDPPPCSALTWALWLQLLRFFRGRPEPFGVNWITRTRALANARSGVSKDSD